MKDIKYEVIQVPFEIIGMSARIMRMKNKEDIESELAMFSKDRGIIPKEYYEDYILSIYVVNIGQLLFFINSNKNLISNFNKFKEELLTKVYDINPLLNPKGLVVTSFGVIKVDDGVTPVDGYPLTSNKSWEGVTSEKGDEAGFQFDDKPLDDIVGSDESENKKGDKKLNNEVLDDHIVDTMSSVKKVKHTYKKKWWDRLTLYIDVRQFSKKDIGSIVLLGNYDDKESYKSFVVTSFIREVESIFSLIDRFGLLTKFTPQQMIDELYNLCIAVNPEAAYEGLKKKTNVVSSKRKRLVQKTDYKALKDILPEKMLNLEKDLNKSVIGQNEAINIIVKAMKRSRIGIKEPTCPIGSFLLAGQTGVGKTLLAKTLAEKLFKKEADGGFVRIDCSEYSSDHEYSKLIGSPAGYVRSDEGGILTNAVIEHPFSVVLFDEVEKASTKVHQLMLQVMDEGILTDNQGETVSFKDTLILMTSNIGSKDVQGISKTIGFGNVGEVTDKKKNVVISKAIKNTFKPEFLNRLTGTVYFNNIDKKTCSKIVELELSKINDYLKNRNIFINFSNSVKRFILNKGYSKTYGAREIKRTVEKYVSDSLADYIINECIEKDVTLDTRVKNKNIIYTNCKTITDFVSESLAKEQDVEEIKELCNGDCKDSD